MKVCERWDSFHQFVEDMGPKPPNTSLDRIDGDGDYEPSNCRWATNKEQGRNKSDIVRLNIDGVEYLACDIAEKAGLKTDTVIARAARGLSYEQVAHPGRLARERHAMRGMLASNKAAREAPTCIRGHPFSGDNLEWAGRNQQRVCRTCRLARQAEYRERVRAKRTAMSCEPA